LKSNSKVNSNPWLSFIPKGWDFRTLEQLCYKIIDNRGRTAPTSDFGIPLIATNCIKNEKLYPTYEKIRYVSQETYENWFRGHPEPGDIIFVNKGTPGQVCLAPDPTDFCIAQDMVAIRPNKDLVDGEYLLAALRSPFLQRQVEGFHVGTLIPHLKKRDFKELILPLPPRHIQNFIGKCYCNISRQIDVLEKINYGLEKISQTIFKSWFIDFDSQTEFIDSELGKIPKDWNVRKIEQVCDTYGGGTPSTKNSEYWNGDINWAVPSDLTKSDKFFLLKTERKITQKGLENCSSKLHPENSILMTSRATIGYFSINHIPIATNQGFIVIEPKNLHELFYLLNNFQHRVSEFINQANGTTFLEISRGTFRKLLILIPPKKLLYSNLVLFYILYNKLNHYSLTILHILLY